MKKILFLIGLIIYMSMSVSHAEAFNLSFNDLEAGTDVLDSYIDIEGITFTSGLCVFEGGAYIYEYPNHGAHINGGTTVTMSIPNGTNLLSFYYNGSAELKAYDFSNNLLFQETIPYMTESWTTYGTPFLPFFHTIDFIVPQGGSLEVDPLTNEGYVVPEPGTVFLLVSGFAGFFSFAPRKH